LFQRLFAITKNAFTEITRQPAYGILLLVGAALIALSPIVTGFTMEHNVTGGGDVRLVIDMGLATILLVGLILAVLSATQVVSREIEVKTAGAVISKPVSRLVLVAGKFLGVSAAMGVASYLLTVILLMTVRMDVPTSAGYTLDWPVFIGEVGSVAGALGFAFYANYFYRWNFTSTAVLTALAACTISILALCVVGKESVLGGWADFASKNAGPVLSAAILVSLGVWVLSSVAVAASTRLNVVSNVIVCCAVFFVGMVSQYLFGWAVDASWGTWDPDYQFEQSERMLISGHVRTSKGEGMAGVRMSGLPEHVVTDEEGAYEARVQRDRWGSVTPRLKGYSFNPTSRQYLRVESDRPEQDYAGIEVASGWSYALSTAWRWTAWTAYHVVPSFQSFWVADQLSRPQPAIPWSYVRRAALYASAWCAAMVAFAAFLFEKREII